MSKIRPLLLDGVEMDGTEREGMGIGGILGVSALWKRPCCGGLEDFKVHNVGRCQLLHKLHVMWVGLSGYACLCVLTRSLQSRSINNIFPTDVLTLTNRLSVFSTLVESLFLYLLTQPLSDQSHTVGFLKTTFVMVKYRNQNQMLCPSWMAFLSSVVLQHIVIP